MATVYEQIRSADGAICRNIELLADQRALLSQNVLSQLRNLVEGVAVLLHAGTTDADSSAVESVARTAFGQEQTFNAGVKTPTAGVASGRSA
jgi:hypothetical protein